MRGLPKTGFLQVRVTPAQKNVIRRAAQRAGMDMSRWILEKALPPNREKFQTLTSALAGGSTVAFSLAELDDFLTRLSAPELSEAVAEAPPAGLSGYCANYAAAMVEMAAVQKGVAPPPWTAAVPPLAEPVFGADLVSLRLHLLTQTPLPFRRRNIFVDTGVGQRV